MKKLFLAFVAALAITACEADSKVLTIQEKSGTVVLNLETLATFEYQGTKFLGAMGVIQPETSPPMPFRANIQALACDGKGEKLVWLTGPADHGVVAVVEADNLETTAGKVLAGICKARNSAQLAPIPSPEKVNSGV